MTSISDSPKKKMPPANPLHVVVRLMPSTGLEGAFRVHVQPESLNQASLKVGDVCKIESESDKDGASITGYGIAWRAADGMTNRPKNRPIKMTETIRTAFGFDEGSRVTISATDVEIMPADSIVISDVTPPEYNHSEDDGRWRSRITGLLVSCEALTAGVEFDVATSNKKSKRRYCIDSIDSAAVTSEASLFSFVDQTQVIFPGQDSSTPNGLPKRVKASEPVRTSARLDSSPIAGLLEQCQLLNRRLRQLLNSSQPGPDNAPILLHGYEGCGKTLLLDQLTKANFRKVLRLDRSVVPAHGGVISKNQAIIQDTFKEAVANQPSLILMDDLERLLPSTDTAYGPVLARELSQIHQSRVMVVGATRSLSNVNADIIGRRAGAFVELIEVPIPDIAARQSMLDMLGVDKELISIIASRTHGFTGEDVALLNRLANLYAADRRSDELEAAELVRSQTPPAYEDVVNSPQAPEHESGVDLIALTTLTDYETALKKVKPKALREIFTEKPTIRWSDIGGSENVKDSFDSIIGWVTTKKEKVAKFGYHPPKGILLYGPPGCSKTLTAQAVANMYNYNFIVVKGAELISMYVGESERAVREVFRKAKAAAPCVIFFDEIDSIGEDRDTSGTKGLNVLTTLLNEMDGFENLKDVLILAATNKPETLDPALMRPGRFDKKIYLGPPNEAARREILAIATKKAPISPDVDFAHLVRETEKYSGADLVRVCEAAKEFCLKRDGEELSASDFSRGREETSRSITDEMLHAYEEFSQGSKFVK